MRDERLSYTAFVHSEDEEGELSEDDAEDEEVLGEGSASPGLHDDSSSGVSSLISSSSAVVSRKKDSSL
jgi:hypothetical protein